MAPPELPGFVATMDPSDAPSGRACPLRAISLTVTRRRRWGLPCCVRLPVHTCCRQYPGGILESVARASGLLSADTPASRNGSLPHSPSRSASHVGTFEACTAFTCVTACMLAEPPGGPLTSECFYNKLAFVAPTATGWNDSCRVGLLSHWKSPQFTAHRRSLTTLPSLTRRAARSSFLAHASGYEERVAGPRYARPYMN